MLTHWGEHLTVYFSKPSPRDMWDPRVENTSPPWFCSHFYPHPNSSAFCHCALPVLETDYFESYGMGVFLFGILSEWFMLQFSVTHSFPVVLLSILLGYAHCYLFTFNGLLDDFKMNRENECSSLDCSNVFALNFF